MRMHTVSRTLGSERLLSLRKSGSGAGAEFVNKVLELIEANAARDTLAGWRLYRSALRIAFAIEKGTVVGAEVCAWGELVTFTAG